MHIRKQGPSEQADSYCSSLNFCMWVMFSFRRTALKHPDPMVGFTIPFKEAEKAVMGEVDG